MPSLIYIARIQSLSSEFAQSLRSAGCHVQSFKPGDITQDECLLAMTPEAADIVLHPKGVAIETDPQRAPMTAPALAQLFGSDTTYPKAAVGKEIHDGEPLCPSPSNIQSEAAHQAVSSATGAPRAVSDSHGKAHQPMAPVTPPPIAAPSFLKVVREGSKSGRVKETCYRMLRNPLSTVVAVLLLAIVYRGLPLMTASPGRTAGRSTSGSAVSVELSPPTVQPVQRHVSPDGFVAEDFTSHPSLHASANANQQNIDLKHSQRSAIPKRIVVD